MIGRVQRSPECCARLLLMLLLCGALSGCGTWLQRLPRIPETKPEPASTPTPEPAEDAVSVPATVDTVTAAPAPAPKAEPAIEQIEIVPQSVAIILSNNTPGYTEIAEALQRQLGDRSHEIFYLNGDVATASAVAKQIHTSKHDRVVAVGLLAAQAVRPLRDKQVVFSQVFNHREHGLVAAHSKGVSVVPPPKLLFHVWRDIDPELGVIGIVTGPDHDGLITDIKREAEHAGIAVLYEQVESDKEALYVFRRMVPNIQGFWILPDNRILSPSVIKEIISYGRKHKKQVVGFSSMLLKLGALMSFENRSVDVAKTALSRFQRIAESTSIPGPEVLALTDMRIRINSDAVAELQLVVPERYRDDIVTQ